MYCLLPVEGWVVVARDLIMEVTRCFVLMIRTFPLFSSIHIQHAFVRAPRWRHTMPPPRQKKKNISPTHTQKDK